MILHTFSIIESQNKMKILPAAFFLISILLTLSCGKEETSPFGLNCENLKRGIIPLKDSVLAYGGIHDNNI